MEVINLYKLAKDECCSDDVVFIGRNSDHYKAKFGFARAIPELANPFKIGVDGERGECVLKYHKWLQQQIKTKNQFIIRAILSLKETDKLACFCPDPLKCHGSVIIRAYNYLKGIDVRDK